MPGMKMKRMVPMMGKGGSKYGYSKGGGKHAGAKALMEKFKEMGIAKMGNGEKLLQKSMGGAVPVDLTAVVESSMRYGGGTASTYSGPKKSKKAKKGRKK